MAKTTYKNGNGGVSELLKELWNAAVALRGNIEPADYKRYVLPLIFLRFLSLRFEKRHTSIALEECRSNLLTFVLRSGRTSVVCVAQLPAFAHEPR